MKVPILGVPSVANFTVSLVLLNKYLFDSSVENLALWKPCLQVLVRFSSSGERGSPLSPHPLTGEMGEPGPAERRIQELFSLLLRSLVLFILPILFVFHLHWVRQIAPFSQRGLEMPLLPTGHGKTSPCLPPNIPHPPTPPFVRSGEDITQT